MNMIQRPMQKDNGPNPYVVNVSQEAMMNDDYRTTFWTGDMAQMTLMSILVDSDIGLEIHKDTDQIIRIEHGMGQVKMGDHKEQLDYQLDVRRGDVIFVPAGTWHNVVNIGRMSLKVSVIYAPPHHLRESIHKTKQDAQ